jgi:hypothetical protein
MISLSGQVSLSVVAAKPYRTQPLLLLLQYALYCLDATVGFVFVMGKSSAAVVVVAPFPEDTVLLGHVEL